MGRLVGSIALAIASLCGCGDPFVVVGDAPGTVRIVAGVPDSVGDGLAERGTEILLDTPLGLAAGADGTVYIADHNNARILAVASSGRVDIVVEGNTAQQELRLMGPDGLVLDGRGGLVIADPESHRIWRLEIGTSELAPLVGTGVRGAAPDTADALLADLDTPTGIAIASDGRVYFTEFLAHRVRRLEPDGTIVTVAGDGFPGFAGDGGPAALARLRRPAGIAIADGVLYIADSGNHRIRAVDTETWLISTLAGQGLAGFDGDGGSAAGAKLDAPLAVAVSSDARTLFIADSNNHRIRAVNLRTMVISTFAGTGDDRFNGDLLAAGETAISSPRGITVSPLDFLYISDTGHHIVRRTAVRFFSAP